MVELAKRITNETKRGELVPYLNRQKLGMLFGKEFKRTRVSF